MIRTYNRYKFTWKISMSRGLGHVVWWNDRMTDDPVSWRPRTGICFKSIDADRLTLNVHSGSLFRLSSWIKEEASRALTYSREYIHRYRTGNSPYWKRFRFSQHPFYREIPNLSFFLFSLFALNSSIILPTIVNRFPLCFLIIIARI